MGCGTSNDTSRVVEPLASQRQKPNANSKSSLSNSIAKPALRENNRPKSSQLINFFRSKKSKPKSSSQRYSKRATAEGNTSKGVYKISRLSTLQRKPTHDGSRVNLLIEDGFELIVTDELILS